MELYLKDSGICKRGNSFYYNKNGCHVSDPKTLSRLSKFRVPPAWNNVWYSSSKKCHIQVHGIDGSGKKQYILSEEWISNSKSEKYNRIKSFIKNIASFKRKINIVNFKTDCEIIIKLLFNLMLDTHIRVGNEIYADTNKTYGLTTLRQKHLVQENGNYYFNFIGKSKIHHNVLVPPRYHPFLKVLLLQNSNKPLFWYNHGSEMKIVTSEMLNTFLKEQMGKEYTCKDFRTYSANILFIKAFLRNSRNPRNPRNPRNDERNAKKIILESIDSSAKDLGHSRNISRKSYISTNLVNYCLDSFESASSESESELLSKI